MTQNYKIFINDTPLFLIHNKDADNLPQDVAITCWDNSQQSILSVINLLEKSEDTKCTAIVGKDIQQLKEAFFKCYNMIEAAGGIVVNDKYEILMIYRHDKWDLPKGKIDEGEYVEQTAVREVKEETGLQDVSIIRALIPTYHTYYLDKTRILKKTHWFEMHASTSEYLQPQLEECITLVRWFTKYNLSEAVKNTYQSIKEVLEYYLSGK